MDLGNWISVGAIVVTIAGGTGFGLMRGRIGDVEKRLEQSSAWNDELSGRVAYLEGERLKDREKAAQDHAKIAEVDAENRMLTSRLTGKVEWVALTDQLEEHHRQALAWWRKTSKVLDEILAAFKAFPDDPK